MLKKPVFRTGFPVSEASVYTRDLFFAKNARTFFSEFLFWKNEKNRFSNNWDIGQNAFFIFWSRGLSYRFLFLYRSVTNIFIKFQFFESGRSVYKWWRYALKTGFLVSEASAYTRDFVFLKRARIFFSEFVCWKN